MADNNLDVDTGSKGRKVLASRDVGTDIQAQRIDVGPWRPTTVATAEYSVDVLTSGVHTMTLPATATHALISIDTAAVRFTDDGSTPTTGATGNGIYLAAGFIGELACPVALKFIAVSATAQLNISYRKYV
jgi:hypothetical protein